MGTNTLNSLSAPHTIIADDFNQFYTALTGDFVPRNASSGAPESETHSLGSLVLQWKNAYVQNIYIDGALFNPDAVGINTNFAIVSGKTRTTSSQPDFIRASGSGATMTIQATATPLLITANGTSAEITSDIAVSSLTLAPSTQNTCLVNDASLADQEASRYTGENFETPITIDTVGTEISSRVGQYICLKTDNNEYMLAYVESSTSLTRCYRGFFFNSSGAPVPRGTLANNDVLTFMSLGWVFLDSNGSTVDVSYRSATYSPIEPTSPATDDYWFDLVNMLWKRYDGADFQEVNRVLIGLVVLDATNCVASRSFDFTKAYSDKNDVEIRLRSTTQITTKKGNCAISVYGTLQELYAGPRVWDITTDLETGLSEAASTTYYIYVKENGGLAISDKKYFDRRHDLNGFYHPHNSWRCVGSVFNDGSSNLVIANILQNEPQAGTLVYLGTKIASGSGTLDLTSFITSEFDVYEFDLIDLRPAQDNNELFLRTSADNINFDSGANSYVCRRIQGDVLTTTPPSAETLAGPVVANRITLATTIGNAAAEGISGRIILMGPLGTTRRKTIRFNGQFQDTGGVEYAAESHGARNANTNILAIQIAFASGSITSGLIHIYGRRNS